MAELREILKTLDAPLVIGGSDTNATEIEVDGTAVAKGDATCWDDLVGSLVARRLESTSGKLQYNYNNSSITMESGGNISNTSDRLIFNNQIPHAFVADSTMNLHMHWEQIDAVAREFTVQYRIQKNSEAKTLTWNDVVIDSSVNNVFPYVSGTINQITRLVNVDLTGCSISDTVQFRLARTDSVSGDIEAVFVDAHVERNTIGSRQEFVK